MERNCERVRNRTDGQNAARTVVSEAGERARPDRWRLAARRRLRCEANTLPQHHPPGMIFPFPQFNSLTFSRVTSKSPHQSRASSPHRPVSWTAKRMHNTIPGGFAYGVRVPRITLNADFGDESAFGELSLLSVGYGLHQAWVYATMFGNRLGVRAHALLPGGSTAAASPCPT